MKVNRILLRILCFIRIVALACENNCMNFYTEVENPEVCLLVMLQELTKATVSVSAFNVLASALTI